MILTPENYHSPEANAEYMSVSQYKAWIKCAAKQSAIVRGDWVEEEKAAFAFGRYVDIALLTPDKLAAELESNQDAYVTKKKEPRAWVADADACVNRCKSDPYFMQHLEGEHQVCVAFDLFGVKWRSMIDILNRDTGALVDLKTTANIDDTSWSDEHQTRVPFYELYSYWLQFAVYREAVNALWGEYPKLCAIAAVSKQTPPDIRIIEMNSPTRYQRELDGIKANLPRIMATKRGEITPERCETCDYCRATRVLTSREPAISVATESITIDELEKGWNCNG